MGMWGLIHLHFYLFLIVIKENVLDFHHLSQIFKHQIPYLLTGLGVLMYLIMFILKKGLILILLIFSFTLYAVPDSS